MKKLLQKGTAFLLAMLMVLSLVACSKDGGNSGGNEEPQESVATQLTHGKVWSAPSSVKIEQDDIRYANKQEAKLSYQAVKNEYESYQLIISAEKNIKSFELLTADLKQGDAVISKDNITVYVQKYVYYDEYMYNSGTTENGYMPDPLIPMKEAIEYGENAIESGKNGALWVTIYISKETEAGLYEGTFILGIEGEVDGEEETLEIPVSVNVYSYTLTDEVNARTLFSWRYSRVGAGELDGSIEMMEKYYDFAKEYRVSLQSLPIEVLSAEEYIDAVMEHYDEISNFCILNQKGDTNGGIYLAEYRDIVTQEIMALAEHSTAKKNLFDKACIYTIDEPDLTDPTVRTDLISRLDQINEMLQEIADIIGADETGRFSEFTKIPNWEQSIVDIPNVVTLNHFNWLLENKDSEDVEAARDAETILNGLNCICPVFTAVTDDTIEESLEALCEEYDLDLWWYGCVTPRPPAPTYHISDSNLLSSRTVFWLQSKYDVQGNLYWDMPGYTGADQEESLWYAVDLYERPYRADRYPAGDGFLVYPGAAYGIYGPIPSLRLMSIRDGMEEYEILEDLKTSLKENLDALELSETLDGIMNMFYSPVALSTKQMYADGEAGLEFTVLRKNLLETITDLTAQLYPYDLEVGVTFEDERELYYVGKDNYGSSTYHTTKVSREVYEGSTRLAIEPVYFDDSDAAYPHLHLNLGKTYPAGSVITFWFRYHNSLKNSSMVVTGYNDGNIVTDGAQIANAWVEHAFTYTGDKIKTITLLKDCDTIDIWLTMQEGTVAYYDDFKIVVPTN